jgi:hypothetical protein
MHYTFFRFVGIHYTFGWKGTWKQKKNLMKIDYEKLKIWNFMGLMYFSRFLLNLFPKKKANALVWVDIICNKCK